MIVACPTCRTRYQVEDRELSRPAGRTVRCANCGHSWHHLTPPPAPPRLRERPPLLTEAPAITVTPRAAITAPTAPRRGHGGAVSAIFLVLLIGAAVAGAYFARDRIVATWPPAAQLYRLIGAAGEAPGAGLEIANVTSTRNVDGLIVEGDITDRLAIPRAVPRLRVALRDAGQNEIAAKIVDPPKPRLLPGETAHFVVAFLPASDAAVGVVVTFVAG